MSRFLKSITLITRSLIAMGGMAVLPLSVSAARADSYRTVQDCPTEVHQDRSAGTVIGAIAGGLVGNAFSHGKARGAGTALGVVAGAVAGNQLGQAHGRYVCDQDRPVADYEPAPVFHERVVTERPVVVERPIVEERLVTEYRIRPVYHRVIVRRSVHHPRIVTRVVYRQVPVYVEHHDEDSVYYREEPRYHWHRDYDDHRYERREIGFRYDGAW